MFREALSYPTRSPEGGRSVIIGGSVFIIVTICLGVITQERPYAYLAAIGLVPWLLVRGYYVRVIRTTIGQTRPTPPRFNDVKQLFTDGVIAVGIAVVYLLPAVVVLGPLIAVQVYHGDLSALLAAQSISERVITIVVPIIGLLAVVALMSLIGALYALPVAVARFAHSGQWRDSLEVRTVVHGAVTEDYAIAWGISLLLQVLILPVAYLLQFLLVGFFLQFMVGIGVRYCYGRGVGAALGLAPVAEESKAQTADTPDGTDKELESDRDLTPAFVRVDTAQWGVAPGTDAEPMKKSFQRIDSDWAHAETEDNAAENVRDWDLPSAVRRIENERSEDRP